MSRRKTLQSLLCWLVLLALCWPALAGAMVRAWLEQASIPADGSVRLSIETDEGGVPDYAPLRASFDLEAPTSSRQVQWSGGAMRSSSTFVVTLLPRSAGMLDIPALRVGAARTNPLRLQVVPAGAATSAAPGNSAGATDDNAAAADNAVAFIELEVDDTQPYVQQSVGVVVRLFYASQLAAGTLELPTPSGAALQRIDEDRNSVREVRGRRYNVVERRYLLIPERSGDLVLGAARFDGRAAGGFFDDVFGGGAGGQMRARSPERALKVRGLPAGAPQPWLPVQDLQLRYLATPQGARAGQAAALVVQATAKGATRAQMPELPIPDPGPSAQVFAEPIEYDERFEDGSAVVTMTRRYQIVPRSQGTLVVPGLQMPWWDVRAGLARQARLPDLRVQVQAGAAMGMGADPAPVAAPSTAPAPATADRDAVSLVPESAARTPRPWPWIIGCAVLGLLWLGTLLAWLRARRRRAGVPSSGSVVAARRAVQDPAELRRALEQGSIEEILDLLAAQAQVDDHAAVLERLADARQRQALERMLQARWGAQGDVAAARDALRRAFHDGPHWKTVVESGSTGDLPPLYPRP